MSDGEKKMTTAEKKNLASPHISTHEREWIVENPDYGFCLRRSLRGCIRVSEANGDLSWHYLGIRIEFDPEDTYNKFSIGVLAIRGNFEKLSDALDAIERFRNSSL